MRISHSVGKSGTNRKSDVKWGSTTAERRPRGGTQATSKSDGIAGPKTIAAIEDYRRCKFGVCDGRVDPTGKTIKSVEKAIGGMSQELKGYLSIAIALSYGPTQRSRQQKRSRKPHKIYAVWKSLSMSQQPGPFLTLASAPLDLMLSMRGAVHGIFQGSHEAVLVEA